MKAPNCSMHTLDGSIFDRHGFGKSAASGLLHVRGRLRPTGFCPHFLPFLVMLLGLLGCASAWAQNDTNAEADFTYRLGAGDKLQIDVFNQADLTGEFTLDGNGRFSMHLIGKIEAAGLTVAELETLLINKLKPDYLVHPRVSIQVQNYRPYYLIGEVLGTGPFSYVDGMTYMTAVAIAGGFTYRAKKAYVYVIRADDAQREELKLGINEKVLPGDIIRVAERMF